MPRGSKTCQKCGTTTGPRAHECPKCKHPFKFKEKTETAKKLDPTIETQTPKAFVTPKIYAFGKMPHDKKTILCPVKPNGNNEKHIREWITRMSDYRHTENSQTFRLSRSAILQVSKTYWNPQTALGRLTEGLIRKEVPRD